MRENERRVQHKRPRRRGAGTAKAKKWKTRLREHAAWSERDDRVRRDVKTPERQGA